MNILWLSRHCMTSEQLNDLKRIYGDDINVKQYGESVKDWREVCEIGSDCEIFAVVLPPSILGDLTNQRNNEKPVIRAKANRIPTGKKVVNPATGNEESEFMFVHEYWELVEKIEVVTRRL